MIDSYNRLRMEYNGIRKIIDSYTSGVVSCYLDGLKTSIEECNKEEMLFFLEHIVNWYQENLKDIQSNQFVHSSEQREHLKTKKLLEDLYSELKEFDFSTITREKKPSFLPHGAKKIFLSHRSSDKKYADALEKLIVGLGVKNEQLIYTSHPLHKIPLGQKIYDYLRENITDQVFMIILWSNSYLESPACLREMGAAWLLQTYYVGIYTTDF